MSGIPVLARLGLTALAVAAVGAIAAGCGGGGNSSETTSPRPAQTSTQGASDANAWAASFCGYAKTWERSLQGAATTLKASNSSANATSALRTAKTSTTLFSQQLNRLGPPPGGEQAAQQIRQYGNRLKTSNQTLQGIQSEPSDSSSELQSKVADARATLTVMTTQLKQAYTYLANLETSPQLMHALKTNSTCRAVFS